MTKTVNWISCRYAIKDRMSYCPIGYALHEAGVPKKNLIALGSRTIIGVVKQALGKPTELGNKLLIAQDLNDEYMCGKISPKVAYKDVKKLQKKHKNDWNLLVNRLKSIDFCNKVGILSSQDSLDNLTCSI